MKKVHAFNLFRKSPVPINTGSEIEDAVRQLKINSSKEEYLRAAYNLITTQYVSGRANTILRFFDLFSTDVQEVWNRKGFLHCTNQNFLLTVLLIRGGYFNDADIRARWTLIGFTSPHQYLLVRLPDGKWVEVDCWARQYGVGFGGHAHGFNTTLRKSFAH
jgi:hypothetical protein